MLNQISPSASSQITSAQRSADGPRRTAAPSSYASPSPATALAAPADDALSELLARSVARRGSTASVPDAVDPAPATVVGRPQGPVVQRWFYARGKRQRIDDPWYLLSYLLDNYDKLFVQATARNRRGQGRRPATKEQLREDFERAERDDAGISFSAWLKRRAPHLHARTVHRAAFAAAAGRTPYRRRLAEEHEVDAYFDVDVSDPESEFVPRRRRGKDEPERGERKRRRDSTNDVSPSQPRKRARVAVQPEPDAASSDEELTYESSGESEEEWSQEAEHGDRLPEGGARDTGRPGDEFPVVIVTWNLEKTGPNSRAIKQRLILEIVERYHPSIMVMQEVTDAGILFGGVYSGGKDPMPYGLGLNSMNLVENAQRAYLEEQGSRLAESEAKQADEGTIPNYPLAEEFGTHPGPTYRAATYRENYALLYERTKVEGEPVPYFVKSTHDGYKLEEVPRGHVQHFSKKADIRREPLVWKIKLKTAKYSTRPEVRPSNRASDFLTPGVTVEDWVRRCEEHRLQGTSFRETYVMVVHTSPSMSISDEVKDIMAKASWLRAHGGPHGGPAPVILAGDWYMERADSSRFARYATATEGWRIEGARVGPRDVIVDAESRTTYGTSQFLNTNYPGRGGKGQAADHFVVDELARVHMTEMIPATLDTGFLDPNPKSLIDEEVEGAVWRDHGVDHAPIAIFLSVQAPPASSESDASTIT